MKRINNKGITLIALIITIIVLLILAGVTINSIRVNDGIVNKSYEAKTKSEHAELHDSLSVAAMMIKTKALTEVKDKSTYYSEESVFINVSEFDTNRYTIESYSYNETARRLTINIKKTQGTGETHQFIIYIDTDTIM